MQTFNHEKIIMSSTQTQIARHAKGQNSLIPEKKGGVGAIKRFQNDRDYGISR